MDQLKSIMLILKKRKKKTEKIVISFKTEMLLTKQVEMTSCKFIHVFRNWPKILL